MSVGCTAPMSRSRVMPPTFAAVNDSTSTPKMSRRCFTPETAPLNAKTKVPSRSRISVSVLIAIGVRSGFTRSSAQPGLGCGHHAFDPRTQRGIQHRGEARVVIGRNLVRTPFALGGCVHLPVDAADEPEHRWDVPLGAE